jgi:hypothetical protein
VAWEVEYTNEFGEWFETPDQISRRAVLAIVEELEVSGPGLGRPVVDTIKGSRYANMKELRPPHRHMRILFAFDPGRTAILLIGGDKTGQWASWYDRMIPIADKLMDAYLEEIRQEGLIP